VEPKTPFAIDCLTEWFNFTARFVDEDLGIEVAKDAGSGGQLVVTAVREHTADKAGPGMQVGDLISKVNGVSVESLSASEFILFPARPLKCSCARPAVVRTIQVRHIVIGR
jgi:C-terminal processing protease CtpA/Prc